MDKNAIKKYAVWARNELIARVSQKAQQYGITAEGYGDKNADSVNGVLLSATEKKQRQALIAKIDAEGFEQVMEEVAYTWFNRFTALRFMEVNNYLPSHTRVFTNEANEFKPQILADAISLEIEGLDMDRVFELKNANKDEELYKYLLIVQCNSLNCILPGMFQKIEDYTELLLPDYLLREGSVVERLILSIPESNFDVTSESGQLEIIGWLYQYYNDEKKSAVIDMAAKTAIKKEDIPAATQLFTTDWVVKYIIDNTIGRYWIERHPNSGLKSELKYLFGEIDVVNEEIKPEDVTVFDPCIGSGHFGIYAFEVLMKIYLEYGYSEREAAEMIVTNNLFGLDIDERASQLAYFSIMMKARQYDRRFLGRKIKPNIMAISESNHISSFDIEQFSGSDQQIKNDMLLLISELKDAKEYGSLIKVKKHNYNKFYERIEAIKTEENIFRDTLIELFEPIIRVGEILSKQYAVVATNPPYLNKYNNKLKGFLTDNYKEYFGDLFSVFIYRNFGFCISGGYTGFMTPFVWMFIKTYEDLRNYIINQKSIISLIQMEYSAFEEATVPICSFVLKNGKEEVPGSYIRLSDFKGGMEVQKAKVLEAISDNNCGYLFSTSQDKYKKIPGNPIAYWMPEGILNAFKNGFVMDNMAEIVTGISTGKNDIYLRTWPEVDISTIAFYKSKMEEIDLTKTKWIPYNKGGEARKWYGNNDYIVKWSESDDFHRARPTFAHLYLKQGLTWSFVTSGMFSARFYPDGFLWDVAGSPCVINDENRLYYALGYLSTKVANQILKIINPTINCQVIDIQRTPIIIDDTYMAEVVSLARECVAVSKKDWDSYEKSWDFERHPLIQNVSTIEEAFANWKKECDERFELIRRNEQRLNEIFISIFGLENELTPEVTDAEVTVHKADVEADIRSFIEYSVGCMFGRYSLVADRIVCAGHMASNDSMRDADIDNIIPICTDDYFEDDILSLFVSFVKKVYGENNLEVNLQFIASALGGTGTARDIIRDYFTNHFYDDHVRQYQKRPIYWLFDSGKKNGFKCLIYMHRYQPDTIARIRTDYVHEQQSRYRTALTDIEQRINSASTSERVKLNKQLKIIQDQAEELRKYEEKIHHLADQMISINLDDGVKENYAKFQDVLAKIK